MSWQEIERRERSCVEAFNNGDASAFAQHYAEDARVLPPNADMVEGRAGVQQFFSAFMEMGASLALTMLDVHESADMCAEVGRYEVSFQPPGGEPMADSGKFIVVWTRGADGTWVIAEDIFNSSLPAPGS